MTENSKAIVSVLVVLLVASIIGNYYLYDLFSKNEVVLPEGKALLDVQIYDWAENLYDSDEMFFDYWIYNYGDEEAKNIKVRCDLFKADGKTKIVSVVDSYGNMASRSDAFGEVRANLPSTNEGEEFIGLCHAESCDNCEILYKRIPSLIENYE